MIFLYNLLLTLGAAASLPVMLPQVAAMEKRRKTALSRLCMGRAERPRAGHGKRPIWVHALSVGEVLSAVPLVDALKKAAVGRGIVFSVSTLTGHETARRRLAGRVPTLVYYPYDFAFSVRRAARSVDPALVVLVESDVWPNFLFEMKRRDVPVILANARLSDRSFRGFFRFRKIAAPLFSTLSAILAQTEADADRYRRIGVPAATVSVTGNLKFDLNAPEDGKGPGARLGRALAPGPVVVAGSTHDGEEALVLNAFAAVRQRFADAVLVIAPRDPHRSGTVDRICGDLGLAAVRWTRWDRRPDGPRPQVLVVDTLGMLGGLYAAGDIAFVGGSLVRAGGHNPLEPAAVGLPVLFGPDMRDFAEIAGRLKAGGGALTVQDGADLARCLMSLLEDPARRRRMGLRAGAVVHANQGAVRKTVTTVMRILDSRAVAP